jgi:hypothetical protein
VVIENIFCVLNLHFVKTVVKQTGVFQFIPAHCILNAISQFEGYTGNREMLPDDPIVLAEHGMIVHEKWDLAYPLELFLCITHFKIFQCGYQILKKHRIIRPDIRCIPIFQAVELPVILKGNRMLSIYCCFQNMF